MDPHAPTQTSVRADDEGEARQRPRSGAFTADAPTKILPPSASLEEPRLASFHSEAPTQAMDLTAIPERDPFLARATDVELKSFSSEAAEDEDLPEDPLGEGARVDLRPPAATRRMPSPDFDDVDDEDDVVEISLSDMEAVADDADGDLVGGTRDTVVNVTLPASLFDDAPPPSAPAPRPTERGVPDLATLPRATVVERRNHNPASLFDDDTASSATDPRGTPAPTSASGEPAVAPAPKVGTAASAPPPSSVQTAARPSLVSQPSGDPPSLPAAEHDDDAPHEEAPAYWDEDSLPEHDAEETEQTLAPELSEVSEDAPAPMLHKWKVVPTAIRQLEHGAPPPAPAARAGFGGDDRPKTLHTILWSPDDEAAARAAQAAPERSPNPFWAPTDARAAAEEDDDDLESTEAPAPSDPKQAAAAYVHDAVAYLRSLSHFGAHLDDDVRRDFEARVLGANEKLRRALTVLHSASGDDER